MKRRRLRAATRLCAAARACALPAAVAACGPAEFSAPPQPDAWTEVAGARWRPVAVEGGEAGFTSVPPSWSGVDFGNALTDASFLENQMRGNGSGVAAGDVDGDGRPDIYLARLEGPNALYLNLGDWQFRETAVERGVAAADRFSTGATLVDVDGDADRDLILTSIEGPRTLFLNDGAGRFAEVPEAGLLDSRGGMSTALADIDGDGDLDLYLTRYKSRSVLDLFPGDEVAFPNTVRRVGQGFEVAARFADHYELAWRADGVVRLEKGEADELYLNEFNEAGGRFRHVPFSSGAFLDTGGTPIGAAPTEWGLAARFGDLDADGDPDLYVANDLHSPDRLWINRGDGTFRLPPPHALPTTSASSMAVDFSDFDRDGDVDAFVLDMLARDSRSRKTQDPVARVEHTPPGEAAGAQQVNRNTLLANRGDGTWAEIGRQAGVEASGWSWSALFLDVDLDGFEDLLVPNGHIRDLMDADTQISIRDAGLSGERESTLLYRPLPLHNVAFRNLRGAGFEEVGRAWGVAPEPDVSHGAALADFDGDGDLDAVVNRLGSPALVLRNDAASPRLAVRLRGEAPNTAGVGAAVWLEVPGLPRQTKEVAAGGGYLSGSEELVSFAMGDAAEGTLGVEWRDGGRSVVRVDGANRLYEVFEAAAAAGSQAAAGTGAGAAAPPPSPGSAPWFELDESFGPIHDEPPFAEVTRQPLLPLRLSRMGPSVAWHDLDGDGDPDLLMGAGGNAAPVLFVNDGGMLVRVTLAGPRAPVDQTSVIPLPAADTARVLLGLSSYEAPAGRGDAGAGRRVRRMAGRRHDGCGRDAGQPRRGPGDAGRGGRARRRRLRPRRAAGSLRGRPGRAGRVPAVGLVPGLSRPSGRRLRGGPAECRSPGAPGHGDRRRLHRCRRGRGPGPCRLHRVGSGSPAAERPGPVHGGDLGGRTRAARGPLERGVRRRLQRRWTAGPRRGLMGGQHRIPPDGRGPAGTVLRGRGSERHPRSRGGAAGRASRRRGAARRAGPPRRTHPSGGGAHPDAGGLRGGGPGGGAGRMAGRPPAGDGTETHAVSEPGRALRGCPAPAGGAAGALARTPGRRRERGRPRGPLPVPELLRHRRGHAPLRRGPRSVARGRWGRRVPAGAGSGVGGRPPTGTSAGVAAADIDRDGRLDFVLGINGGAARLFRGAGTSPGLRVRLAGPGENRHGIGAVLRVVYADGMGPAREVRAGSGTGSHDDPVQILGLSVDPVAIEVRWPGGAVDRVEVPPGAREVTAGPP